MQSLNLKLLREKQLQTSEIQMYNGHWLRYMCVCHMPQHRKQQVIKKERVADIVPLSHWFASAHDENWKNSKTHKIAL